MTMRIQTNRFVTPGVRPIGRQPGELYVNWPELQLGVIDSSSDPIDLIPVRFFSAQTDYPTGDFVWITGDLYRAITDVSPGAFNPAQWSKIAELSDIVGIYMPIAGGTFTGPIIAPPGSIIPDYMPLTGGAFTGPISTPAGSVIPGYMSINGGTFLGPVILPPGSSIPGYMPYSGGTFLGPITTVAGSNIVGYLPLVGGTLTGPLTLSADPTTALGAATKQYVDALVGSGGGEGGGPGPGDFLPLAGGTMLGPIISVPGDIVNGAAGTRRSIFGQTVGSNRWELSLGNDALETGNNSGSNFGLTNYDDNGIAANVLQINRANGRMTFQAIGAAAHSLTTYPPDVGSSTIVLNKAAGHNCGIVAASNGFNRWSFNLGEPTPETGANAGSNFTLTGFADDGLTPLAELDINRVNGRVTVNAVGATQRSIVTYPPGVGNANFILNRAGNTRENAFIGATNGLNRWQIVPGNGTPEGAPGTNIGSNFDIISFSDNGTARQTPFSINRTNGRITSNGANSTPRSDTKYPPDVGGANMILNKASGAHSNGFVGACNGLDRWIVAVTDSSTESGNNNGSNFVISNCDDSGNALTAVMSIMRRTGQVTFSQPIINGSDRKMKTDIEPVNDALGIISKLEGVFFKHKDTEGRQVGLVAQDVAPALPEVVFEIPANEHQESMLGIAYSNIVAVLVNAVKELSAKVAALEAKPQEN